MRHIGTEPLDTPRLILRRFTPEDAQGLYHNWGKDPEVVRYMRMPPHQSMEDTRAFVQAMIAQYERPDAYKWVVALKETGQPIGYISLGTVHEGDRVADFAYSLGVAYWGRGYATEALAAVLRYGLLRVGYNRIEAYHAIANPASGKVMQKAGMACEGRARQKYRSNAGYEDCDLYAILREDLSP